MPVVALKVIQGGAACKTPPKLSIRTATHAELRAELRRLRAEHCRLIKIEMSLEAEKGERGYQTYRRACEEAKRSERNLNSLTCAILRRPVETWDDVSLLAEAHIAQSPGQEIELLDDHIAGMSELEQRTMACLLTSVLKLSGSTPEMEDAHV